MTDEVAALGGEDELLDAVDQQLLQQLADHAPFAGAAADRGGRPAGPVDQDAGRFRARGRDG